MFILQVLIEWWNLEGWICCGKYDNMIDIMLKYDNQI